MINRATRFLLLLMIAATLAAGPALAQARRGAGALLRMEQGFQRELFTPELVMRYQSEIALSDEQEELLINEMQSLQSDLVPLQFEMSKAAGDVREALAGQRIEEKESIALAEHLMSLEARIKQRHLALMIRVKNVLTPEQQDQLRDLRQEMRDRPGDRDRRPRRPGGPRP